MTISLLDELARRFRAGDMEAAFELYHPRVRIDQPVSLPHGGVHEGRAAVREMGRVFAMYWTRMISEPYRTSCDDGRVLQITRQTWTARSTGKSACVDVVELIAFAGDVIAEIRVFQQDTARLLETIKTGTGT